jgi:signal transduction histidine kinase
MASSGPSAADLLKDWRSNGFLLLGLDGQISLPYADGVPESHREVVLDLATSLGLSGEQEISFRKWLDLVRDRHREMRWEKLAPLCPVSETGASERGRSGRDPGSHRLEFRKLEDGQGNLTALAVFSVDTAPNQAMARQLEEERVRHSLQIRDFLALSANPPETVGAFLEDSGTRLEAVRKQWDEYLLRVRSAASAVAGSSAESKAKESPAEPLWDSETGEGLGHLLFRELHMLKGNAGAFGFDGLAASVQESEDQLESLKGTASAGPGALQRLASSLAGLRAQLDEIRRAMKLISGEGQEAMARILKWKLDRLVQAAGAVEGENQGRLDPRTRALVDQSRRLPYLSPAYLARKYRNLVDRLALNQGKDVRFRVAANTGEIHPESFSRIDEALVHLLRNMVDHGIESPGEREAAGKGEAEIGVEYMADEGKVTLRIRDDGRGMDAETLARRAVDMKLVSAEEAAALPDSEKLALIFREGFTTRDRAGMVSGRGIGLALAARCLADLGGHVSVTSEVGKGTCFTITLPSI